MTLSIHQPSEPCSGTTSGDAGGTDRPKQVCVTGGAGFLGSHLCERLIRDGHHVTALDNFYTGRRANIDWLEGSGLLSVVEHDITEPLPAGLPRFDEIYNLACPASPPHYQADPIKTLATCSVGTGRMLERAARDGARLLHASTSEVYGDPDVHPQAETYWGNVNTVGPRACYDEGKRYAETLLIEFARARGVTVRIPRIFNTYGPRMQPDDGRVVSNFIIQALKGEDITVNGDGSQTRSFCFVDDLIEGFIRLMRAGDEADGPVNLGNPHEVAVGDLANRVIELIGSPSRVSYRPLPVDDPRRRRPDIAKAQGALNWTPRVSLEQGLCATIDYFAAEFGLNWPRLLAGRPPVPGEAVTTIPVAALSAV
jgi:UDP-glucuronate decarboxylase